MVYGTDLLVCYSPHKAFEGPVRKGGVTEGADTS